MQHLLSPTIRSSDPFVVWILTLFSCSPTCRCYWTQDAKRETCSTVGSGTRQRMMHSAGEDLRRQSDQVQDRPANQENRAGVSDETIDRQ